MKLFILTVCLITYVYGYVQQGVVVLNGEISGKIVFNKTGEGIQIQGTINGLPKGKHGFHIHERGDLGENCAAAGGHFNPAKKDHGAPSDENRHVGDLGNIESDENQIANIKFVDKIISLEGENCIIGRALVIHAGEDDLGKGGFEDSKTTGHAGARLACGVVGILNETLTSSSTRQGITASFVIVSLVMFANIYNL